MATAHEIIADIQAGTHTPFKRLRHTPTGSLMTLAWHLACTLAPLLTNEHPTRRS